MDSRKEKLVSLIRSLAADFVQRESSGASLITVTSCEISDDKKYANVLVTVYPDEKEVAALDFLSRKTGELRKYIGDHSRIGRIPRFTFAIDRGEKHRQRIDELSKDL